MEMSFHHQLIHAILYLSFTLSDINCQYVQMQVECPDTNTCFTLYHAEAGITWDRALEQCRGESGRLAIIPTSTAQEVIGRFSGSLRGFDLYSWVGGRRSDDARWRNVRGAVIPEQGSIYDGAGSNTWCSFVEVGVFAGVEAVSCHSDQPYAALCELPKTANNADMQCVNAQGIPGFEASGVCHVISDIRFQSQTKAQNYCWATYNGPLGSVYEVPESYWPQYYQNVSRFWVGFYRRPWVWIESEYVTRPVTFNNWRFREGDEGVDCMIIDFAVNSGWRDRNCDVTVQYFLCEGVHNAGNKTNQTAVSSTERYLLIYQIVVGVLVSVIVAIIVVLVIVWTKLRPRKKPAKLDFPSDMRFHNAQPEAAHATSGYNTRSEPEPEDESTVPKSMATSLPASPNSEAQYDTIAVTTPKSYFNIPVNSSSHAGRHGGASAAAPLENYMSLSEEQRARGLSCTEYECLPGEPSTDPESPDYLQPR